VLVAPFAAQLAQLDLCDAHGNRPQIYETISRTTVSRLAPVKRPHVSQCRTAISVALRDSGCVPPESKLDQASQGLAVLVRAHFD
jgi:hypothetical protein